jgi:hypothetical protein
MSETNRYLDLFLGVCSVFSATEWQTKNVATVPIGYVGDVSGSEHVVFNPVASDSGNRDGLRGILYVEIYTVGGSGPRRSLEIADYLDATFCGKGYQAAATKGFLQFSKGSNVESLGVTKSNNALLHTSYSIQFNYFRKDA